MLALSLVSCLAAAPPPIGAPASSPAPSPAPEPPIELSPAAKQHNARGIALVYAGQDDAGIAELEQAYAAMPDPLRYRAGRGKVLGSLRSALLRRHAATGDRAPLCRLRELLRGHRAALLAALGPSGSPDDVAGTDAAIREVDATLGDRPCLAPRPAPSPTVLATVPPSDPRRPATARPHRIAGGVLLGSAGLATLGTATAAAIYGDRYRRLDALDRELETPAEVAEKERLHHEGRVARTVGVALGVGAGALLVAGVAVLVAAPRRNSNRLGLAPTVTPGAWGLHLSGRF